MAQLNDLIVTGAARFLNTINGKITNASTADHVAWGNVSGKPDTYKPIVGTASTQAAAGNHNHDSAYAAKSHTHDISIATSSGTNQLTLSANTRYALTAGGKSYIFTTPPDTNTWRPVGTGASDAAAGNHTHGISIATDSGTNQLTMAANTKYKLTAGGQSYIFTTPPDTNTTYNFTGTTFKSNTTSAIALNSSTVNQVGYTNGTSAIYGQSDGALYAQAYSGSWVGQIYQDYRSGHIAVRSNNNGTWTDWGRVFDTRNVSGSGGITVNSTTAGITIGVGTVANSTNASTANYAKNGISNITRSGTNFTVTKADGSTFGFTQQDSNTTYSLSTLGIGNVKNYDQSKAIKSITRNGLTFTATALDGTTSTFTQQDTNTTYSLSTLGIGNVKNYDQSKAIKTITRSGLTFTATALDGTTSTFTQQDTNTTYSASTGLTLSGTAFSINANASTCTAAKGAADGADFDFGEI